MEMFFPHCSIKYKVVNMALSVFKIRDTMGMQSSAREDVSHPPCTTHDAAVVGHADFTRPPNASVNDFKQYFLEDGLSLPCRRCPYNGSHMVLESFFSAHMSKCARKYPNYRLKWCIYDLTHRVEPQYFQEHEEKTCPLRDQFWSYILGGTSKKDQPPTPPPFDQKTVLQTDQTDIGEFFQYICACCRCRIDIHNDVDWRHVHVSGRQYHLATDGQTPCDHVWHLTCRFYHEKRSIICPVKGCGSYVSSLPESFFTDDASNDVYPGYLKEDFQDSVRRYTKIPIV